MSVVGNLMRLRPRYVILAVAAAAVATVALVWVWLAARPGPPAGVSPLGEEEQAWLAQHGQLRLAGRWNEPPFGFPDDEGAYHGYEVDLAESLGPILGVGVEVRPMTEGEALIALANGEIDAVMGVARSPETADRYSFTEPYVSSSLAIFVAEDRFDIVLLEDLRDREVAVQSGTAADSLLEADAEISPLVVESAAEGLVAVVGGQVDALLADEITGLRAAQEGGFQGSVKLVGLPQQRISYSFLLPKDAETQQRVLNYGLASVAVLGVKDQIDRAWLGSALAAPEPTGGPGAFAGVLILVVVGLVLVNGWFILRRIRRGALESPVAEQAPTRYQTKSEQTRDAVFTSSGDLELLEVNRGLEMLTGYPKDVLLRKSLLDLFAPANRRALRSSVDVALREGRASLERTSLVDSHGAEIPVSLAISSASEPGREMVVGTLRDRREEERLSGLMELRSRYLSAMNSIASIVNDAADMEEMLSEVLAKVLELTEADCGIVYLGRGGDGATTLTPVVRQGLTEEMMKELAWPEGPSRLAQEVAKAGRLLVYSGPGPSTRQETEATRGGTGSQAGIPLASRDRAYGVMTIYSRAPRRFTDDDVALLTTVGNQLGVAVENSQLMQRLQRTVSEMGTMRRFSESVLQDMTNGLVVVDRDGKVRLLNRAGESLLGRKEKEVLDASIEDLLGRGARVVRDSMERELAYPSEEILVRRDGGEALALGMSVSPWRGEGGRVNGAVVMLRDLSREKEMEEERTRLDRLALLGEWSAVMAHEIRNPLAGMAAGIQHLLTKFPEEDERYDALRRIQKEEERVSRTIDDILLISRPPRLNLAACDIREILSDVVNQRREKAAGRGVEVTEEYGGDLPDLRADRVRLEQAFSNLLSNAIEAMPNGGQLTMAVREHRATGGSGEADENWVEIVISDTGIGISQEDLSKILDPFFTTKPGGTGLGLPIAQRIIGEHGGQLNIQSTEGEGTTVVVRLPLVGRSRR
jgi:PAS domain S-box-containing protein